MGSRPPPCIAKTEGPSKPNASVGAFLRYARFDAWLSQQDPNDLHGMTRDTLAGLASQLYQAFVERLSSSQTPSFGRGDGHLPRSAACVNTVLRSKTKGALELPMAVVAKGCAMKAAAMEVLMTAILQHLQPLWEELKESVHVGNDESETASQATQKSESTKVKEEEGHSGTSDGRLMEENEHKENTTATNCDVSVGDKASPRTESEPERDCKTAVTVDAKQENSEESKESQEMSKLPTEENTDSATKSNSEHLGIPDAKSPSSNDRKPASKGTKNTRSGNRSKRSVEASPAKTSASIEARTTQKRGKTPYEFEPKRLRSSVRLQNKVMGKIANSPQKPNDDGDDGSSQAARKGTRSRNLKRERPHDDATSAAKEPSATPDDEPKRSRIAQPPEEDLPEHENPSLAANSLGPNPICKESQEGKDFGKKSVALNKMAPSESKSEATSTFEKKEAANSPDASAPKSAVESTTVQTPQKPGPGVAVTTAYTAPAVKTTCTDESRTQTPHLLATKSPQTTRDSLTPSKPVPEGSSLRTKAPELTPNDGEPDKSPMKVRFAGPEATPQKTPESEPAADVESSSSTAEKTSQNVRKPSLIAAARTQNKTEETTRNSTNPEALPSIDKQMDQLLSLLSSRRRGRVDNDRVEEAVENFVRSLNNGKHPQTTLVQDTSSNLAQSAPKTIALDDTNYDDEVEEQESSLGESVKGNTPPSLERADAQDDAAELQWTGETVTVENLKNQEQQLGANEGALWKQWECLDDVPMGKTGAKMMVTFGDGKNPDPRAVAVALLGARECLQNAIRDARAWRRREQQDYKRAQVAVNLHLKKIPNRQLVPKGEERCVDAEMMFRAFERYDKLSHSPQCGFHIPQLEQLFPEEMNAYKRWTSMHDAYTSSKDMETAEDSKPASQSKDGDATEASVAPTEVQSQSSVDGGHLHERLAHFDARTERMMNDWYLTFSEVRQGSFISRGGSSPENRQWEESRRAQSRRGRGSSSASTTWESLPASFVPFLHWIGFDPNSALRPPNEATAQALAFLGYDFMGRIVEKAIFLRFLNRRSEARNAGKLDHDDVLEMRKGEQLTAADVERALKDSSVLSKPLYRSRKTDEAPRNEAVQLYFGPGFERRLEMEMEEIVRSKDGQVTESVEEAAFMEEEAALFSKLREPPKLLKGVLDVLGDDLAVHQRLAAQSRKEKRSQSATSSDGQGQSPDAETPKRKRGRPKGSKNKKPSTRKSPRLSSESKSGDNG